MTRRLTDDRAPEPAHIIHAQEGAAHADAGMSDQFRTDGGAEGDRTPDLRNAIATLSQLSYGPIPFREAAH